MNFLIDTHVLLWYLIGDERIGSETQEKLEKETNTIFLSNASLWEIAIKVSIGKLILNVSISDLKRFLEEKGFILLEYDYDDLEQLLRLLPPPVSVR